MDTLNPAESDLLFSDRASLRQWLATQPPGRSGVWLVFGKRGGPTTVTAAEALEEALCHGWIDGVMKRIDDHSYRKYFAPRRPGSSWSARNRALAQRLESQGVMTASGIAAIRAAQAGGSWDTPRNTQVAQRPDEDAMNSLALLIIREPARTNWLRMPPSVRRTYTAFYLDAKSDATRARRLERILDRLDANLKPM